VYDEDDGSWITPDKDGKDGKEEFVNAIKNGANLVECGFIP
jgi:hypothetical protein